MLTRRQSVLGAGSDFQCVGNMPRGAANLNQIRVLTLNDGEHHDSTLYRLQKGWRLQFRMGPSLFGKRVSLFTNHPAEAGDAFDRTSYRQLSWRREDDKSGDDTAAYAELQLCRAGAFHFYFSYSGVVGNQGSGYVTVQPVLSIGSNEVLPLDCIQCQTVLAKSLGPLDTWEQKLLVSRESGYNMVHFTPVQELGGSNSSYSLSNQLRLNPVFNSKGREVTISDVEALTNMMRTDWKVLSMCDIVLNHTANETVWLNEHPECTYNCVNSPHLRPAYLLDAVLHQLTLEVADGKWQHSGIPREVNTEDHLNAIRNALRDVFLPRVAIPELYGLDVSALVDEFYTLARTRLPPSAPADVAEQLKVVTDPMFRRLKSGVDMELALKLYNVYRSDCFDEDTRLRRCTDEFRQRLSALDQERRQEIQRHLDAAVENSVAGIRYFRVQADGPRVKAVTEKDPLVPRYFTSHGHPADLKAEEALAYSDVGRFLMAHNGWVMNSDPLQNFAAPGSNVYVRREVIAWGDSVKLRYGDKPEDCPYLWQLMKDYVEQTARTFDGIRLDNCHSTPLPVAEYLLDAARRVRPDLYVAAELFTNSDEKDNIFVNRLGITSLIREAMSAWDSHEEGRLVYRYGGEPVGAFYQPPCRPLVASIAHALFLDQTHDNPSPVEKRSAFDLLPSAALVAMACCASGSNRGYDELVPHHIHVVDEGRQYAAWSEDTVANPTAVNDSTGIIAAKRALNKLHYHLGRNGFTQVFVDQVDSDVVAVTRHCATTRDSVILLAHTAFSHPTHSRGVKPLRVEGEVVEVVIEATLSHRNTKDRFARPAEFVRHPTTINGLADYRAEVREAISVEESAMVRRVDSGSADITQLDLHNFPPGSVVAIRVRLNEAVAPAITQLNQLLSGVETAELNDIVASLSLPALNRALYRCSEEERDEDSSRGTYDIPGMGPLVYCGLQGFESVLCNIRANNDLGHPMCNNLRLGNWMCDYVSDRLKSSEDTRRLGEWFASSFSPLKKIPRYLVPAYFDYVLTQTYQVLLEAAWAQMDPFVANGSTFIRGLALGTVQCTATVKSAQLPPLMPDPGNLDTAVLPTLCAGLPHFTVGYMRNWGRDTFISLPGLLLLTGRFQDAKNHILGYAACLRHGLIPNLLDGGHNARFNCRDAVWWWLHAIRLYCASSAPDARTLLRARVARLYAEGASDQPLHDVVQEALETHFQGLAFRERRAGREIDAHMTDQGFNVQIGVHPETGFVFGGNAWNCGTWMDKMGSSERAGTRGKPASPRDGSAVELVGLSKAALRFLAAAHERGEMPHRSVSRRNKDGTLTVWTYREWEQRIAANFERHFFVSAEGAPADKLVHRRAIYKDTYKSALPWTDYQLRPNFPIAMVAAPEMFEPAHAWAALAKVGELLLGPLGMRTLDPADWSYDGDYNNANDSDNAKLAHGFNYHNGPEWVWPMGYYLRARLLFARAVGGAAELRRTADDTRRILARHFSALQSDAWRGLPELTNKDGAYCGDSCRTQAWSMGCILEVLHDLSLLDHAPADPEVN